MWLPRIGKVARLHDRIQAVAELHRFILCTKSSGRTANEVGGATSQLDLPSLAPLSVAGCGDAAAYALCRSSEMRGNPS